MYLFVSKYLIPKGFIGLSVFPFVILRDKENRDDKVILNHEKIHIKQQLELLIIPFFIWYFADYFFKLMKYKDKNVAYRNIIFEREAYENEKDLNYMKSRPFWQFLKYFKQIV
jgi:hypothetical protein